MAAGLISRTTRATRPLFPCSDNADTAPPSAEEQARARSFRDRATRKVKMAGVLGAGGFDDETRQALLETIHTLAGALAVEHRLPEPPAIPDARQASLLLLGLTATARGRSAGDNSSPASP
jgi:hypothetical protein